MIIVWRLSRLTRSLKQLIDIVYNELRPRTIGFKCITQDIDTTTATGRLALNIMGAFDEFEHDLISENVKEGMANAKLKGKLVGRKRVGIDTKRLLGAYEKCQGVRPAVRLYNEGLPDGEKLNPGTAHGILSCIGVLKKGGNNQAQKIGKKKVLATTSFPTGRKTRIKYYKLKRVVYKGGKLLEC